MQALLAIAVVFAMIAVCTSVHYEAVRYFDAMLPPAASPLRKQAPVIVAGVIAAHVIEIGVFAVAYWFSSNVLRLGSFVGGAPRLANEYFALAAESYTSFGYGDIVPNGWLRFIVSVAPLTGLLLLAWSGAFLYGVLHRRT